MNDRYSFSEDIVCGTFIGLKVENGVQCIKYIHYLLNNKANQLTYVNVQQDTIKRTLLRSSIKRFINAVGRDFKYIYF